MSASQTYQQHVQFVATLTVKDNSPSPSNQLHPLHAGVPVLADDNVVVHDDAERGGDVDDGAGHLDVGLRRRGVAGGVVVHQDDGGGGQFQRAFYHFAGIDRGVVHGAGLLQLVRDQLVALVEE